MKRKLKVQKLRKPKKLTIQEETIKEEEAIKKERSMIILKLRYLNFCSLFIRQLQFLIMAQLKIKIVGQFLIMTQLKIKIVGQFLIIIVGQFLIIIGNYVHRLYTGPQIRSTR